MQRGRVPCWQCPWSGQPPPPFSEVLSDPDGVHSGKYQSAAAHGAQILSHPTIPASIPAYCKLAQILLVLPFGQPAASLDQACMDTLRTSSSTQEGLSQPQLTAAMRIRCSPPRPERVFAHWQRYMAIPT